MPILYIDESYDVYIKKGAIIYILKISTSTSQRPLKLIRRTGKKAFDIDKWDIHQNRKLIRKEEKESNVTFGKMWYD